MGLRRSDTKRIDQAKGSKELESVLKGKKIPKAKKPKSKLRRRIKELIGGSKTYLPKKRRKK